MMTTTRKKYDKEFKQKAIELAAVRGNTAEVAEELGIKADLLYRWRREQSQYDKNSFPGQGKSKLTDQEREIARLNKELRDTKMERDILKKAISIFSSSDGKGINS